MPVLGDTVGSVNSSNGGVDQKTLSRFSYLWGMGGTVTNFVGETT